MFFKRFEPSKELATIIDCYWIVEERAVVSRQQKIIPDGFNEIIFHYGEPYHINIQGHWEQQPDSLFAGQLRKHFFLENTGHSGIIGVKLKPTTLTHLFGLTMLPFTDRVVELNTVPALAPLDFRQQLLQAGDHGERVDYLDKVFKTLLNHAVYRRSPIDQAIDIIFATNGMTTVSSLSQCCGIGERQLENLFKKYIGLPPKFYMRIIRFNYIFKLVQENQQSWSGLAYEASFFDQSHFIRNFRDFTGENPADYSFNEKNLANFFLHRGQ